MAPCRGARCLRTLQWGDVITLIWRSCKVQIAVQEAERGEAVREIETTQLGKCKIGHWTFNCMSASALAPSYHDMVANTAAALL